MCKKKAMRYACHGKFGDGDVQFLADYLDGLIHVIDAQVLADEAQEVLRSSGNNDLTLLLVQKADGIPDQVAPGPGGCAQQDGIVPAFFHFMDHIRLGVLYQIPVGIEILAVEGDELEKDMLVGDETHAPATLGILVGDESFGSEIGFDIGQGFAQELLKTDPVGLERYAAVYEEGQVGPDLVDIVQLVVRNDVLHT